MSDYEILESSPNGKRKVKLVVDGNAMYLHTMQNGVQWSSCSVDVKTLKGITKVINRFNLKNPEPKPVEVSEDEIIKHIDEASNAINDLYKQKLTSLLKGLGVTDINGSLNKPVEEFENLGAMFQSMMNAHKRGRV